MFFPEGQHPPEINADNYNTNNSNHNYNSDTSNNKAHPITYDLKTVIHANRKMLAKYYDYRSRVKVQTLDKKLSRFAFRGHTISNNCKV